MKRHRYWSAATLFGLLVLSIVGIPLIAEEPGHSIILKLREQSDDVRSAVLQGLTPKVETLRGTLHEAGEEVQEALGVYQRDRTETAALRFEDAVSQGLLSATQGLEGILEEREHVLASTDAMRKSVREATQTFSKKAGDYKQKVTDRKQESDRLYSSLEGMAERFGDVIQSGEPLPADADLKVRQVYQAWKVLETRTSLYQRANSQMETWVARIGKYDGVLERIRGEYDVIFGQADGQLALLTDVADVRGAELEITTFIRELGQVTGEIIRARDGMDGVVAGIEAILQAPPLLDPDATPEPEIRMGKGQGLEILQTILNAKKGGADVPS